MFYKGVVENVEDELKIGRVQIRIIGKHGINKNDTSNVDDYLPTEDLPWATPIFPAGSSSISGISNFAVPDINSVVVCGYFDNDEQELFYIGTLALIGSNKLEGFGLEEHENPKKEYPLSDSVSTVEDLFPSEVVTNPLFEEPQTEHEVVYPLNKVIETKSGHLIEIDDTEGIERIRIRHKSGSFQEYHNNGDIVNKSIKDKYIIAENVNVHSNGNTNVYVGDNLNIEVETDVNFNVKGNVTGNVDGDVNVTIGGNFGGDVTGNVEVSAGGDITGDAGGNVDISAGGNVTVTGGGEIRATAPMIYLN